jgi:hypothetical protein
VSRPAATTSGVPPTDSVQARVDPAPQATRDGLSTPEASKPMAEADARKASPPAPAKADTPLARGTLLVMCDRDCSVSVDGVAAGESTAGRGLSVPASMGQHLIKVTGGGATWENVTDVPSARQVLVRTNLAAEIAKIETAARQAAEQTRMREEAEQAERDRQARLAEQQRRDQQARDAETQRQQQLARQQGAAPLPFQSAPTAPQTPPTMSGSKILSTKATNDKGRYSISVPSGPSIVQFHLDGFVTKRYEVSVGMSLDVILEVGRTDAIKNQVIKKGGWGGGNVRGTVTDSSGAVLPGVTVTVFKP